MAEALGISEAGVKTRHFRAVVRMRSLLEADTMIDHDELVLAGERARPGVPRADRADHRAAPGRR